MARALPLPGVDVRPLLKGAKPEAISIKELQRRLKRKSYTSLWLYVSGALRCPAELCAQIELVTDGAVPRLVLNPWVFGPLTHGSSSLDAAS